MRIDLAKIALLIPRLSSNFEGEVVATVSAIRRVLNASGHDLHDLAQGVAKGSLTQTSSKNDYPSRERSSENRQRQDRPADIIQAAGRLLECS
jgi:hypothetical protein